MEADVPSPEQQLQETDRSSGVEEEPQSGRERLARQLSIIGHPFILLVVYVAVASSAHVSWQNTIWAVAIVLGVSILPMTLYLCRLVRQGRSNFDISSQDKRGPAYALGLVLGVVLWVIFYWLGTPEELLRHLVIGIAMVVVASLINLRLKVSLHSAFSGWVASALLHFQPILGVGVILLALAVMWSRLELKRHTLPEVGTGFLLGLLMSLPVHFF